MARPAIAAAPSSTSPGRPATSAGSTAGMPKLGRAQLLPGSRGRDVRRAFLFGQQRLFRQGLVRAQSRPHRSRLADEVPAEPTRILIVRVGDSDRPCPLRLGQAHGRSREEPLGFHEARPATAGGASSKTARKPVGYATFCRARPCRDRRHNPRAPPSERGSCAASIRPVFGWRTSMPAWPRSRIGPPIPRSRAPSRTAPDAGGIEAVLDLHGERFRAPGAAVEQARGVDRVSGAQP